MIEVNENNRDSKKPHIGIIAKATISEIMPLLTPIAIKKNLNLSRLSDFREAVEILEDCILREIWHTGWSNVNWNNYTEVKADILTIEDFNINIQLLSDFLNIRSKNIINLKRVVVVR